MVLFLPTLAAAAEPPQATLVPRYSLARQLELYEDEKLVLEAPLLPAPGWTVRYGGGTPMNSVELVRAFGDPALALDLHERQRRYTTIGTAQLVLGVAAFYSGYILGATDPEEEAAVAAGALILGGVVLEYTSIVHFVNRSRQAKHPATWMNEADADRRVAEHNAALAEELGVSAVLAAEPAAP